MAIAVVDWTVDKLLSGVKTVNARLESERNTLRANRAAYLTALRSLPTVPNVSARERIRASLGEWIHGQVAVENRFNSIASAYASAKAAAKRFLSSVGVTPPPYLGQLPAVPAVVYGGIAVALAALAIVHALNLTQSKKLDVIENVLDMAKRNSWSAAETTEALKAAAGAVDVSTPDPLGLSKMLEKALPVIVIVAALFLFGPMLQRRIARA